jgi:hypothetical protein
MLTGRTLVWFSCGAASAVALKLAAQKYPDVRGIYCDLSRDEHPDNARFRADVEKWTGVKVEVIKSKLYNTVEEAWDARKYMSGVSGAPCTVEMKKVPRFAYQWAEDVHIFGLTVDEQDRIRSFENENHELFLEWTLRDAGLTKPDCLQMLRDTGIEIPVMYRLGFENNNCIGCVKATSPRYWNLVRKHFPDVFKRRAEQSRRLGAKLARYKGARIYLDELPSDATEQVVEDLSCGPQCRAPQLDEAKTQNRRGRNEGLSPVRHVRRSYVANVPS